MQHNAMRMALPAAYWFHLVVWRVQRITRFGRLLPPRAHENKKERPYATLCVKHSFQQGFGGSFRAFKTRSHMTGPLKELRHYPSIRPTLQV
jgi:hypothetical protein